MRGLGRLFVAATIAAAGNAMIAPLAGHAAPRISVAGPGVTPTILEGSVATFLYGTFMVTNKDIVATATIKTLTPATAFAGGDNTDVVSDGKIVAPPRIPCAVGTVLGKFGARDDTCSVDISVTVPPIEPGENMDTGDTKVELTVTTKEGLIDSGTGSVKVKDPVPEPNTFALLGVSLVGIAVTGFLNKSRSKKG